MKLEDAIKNIEQALAAVNGNLQTHQALQVSLKVIKDALASIAAEKPASIS